MYFCEEGFTRARKKKIQLDNKPVILAKIQKQMHDVPLILVKEPATKDVTKILVKKLGTNTSATID